MRSRRIVVAIASAFVLTGLTAATLVLWRPWSVVTAADRDAPRNTALVERTALSANLILSASLEYSAPTTLVGTAGTVTQLPHAGDLVNTGQQLYEVDGQPVIAFAGSRPLWRAVGPGVTDGPDVREVEQNLADLGFGDGLTVDNTFTPVTERSIRAWQKSLGRERTGQVAVGDVVMISAPAVRVGTVTALVGGSAAGPVLTYTDPGIHGRVKLTSAQLTELAPGMGVIVRLPSGTETPASVSAVDPGGAPTADPSKTTTPSARIEFANPSLVQGIGLPAVRVTVGTGGVEHALVVPVTALVALAEGGYAVEVEAISPQRGEKRASEQQHPTRTVPVQLGLIADARAEVVSGDLHEGDRVVVAG